MDHTGWHGVQGHLAVPAGMLLPMIGKQRSAWWTVSSSPHADFRTARALAAAGMMGLVGLPVMMLATIILKAPFAGPAAIAIGYLCAAHALSAGRGRQAAVWTTVVLGGFIGWSLFSALARQDPSSWASLAAVLMAPAFAAAPAVARRFARAEGASIAAPISLAAVPLERRAPAWQSGEPRTEREPLHEAAATPDPRMAIKAPCGPAAGEPVRLGIAPAGPAADVQDAVRFALKQVSKTARLKGVSLVSSGSSTIAAACDRQVCRRVITVLLSEVVRVTPLGSSVHVVARDGRGAVLLRVSCAGPSRGGDGVPPAHPPLDLAALHAMLDEIGGTLVTTESGDGLCASLRLARAHAMVRQGPRQQASGAA